MNPTDGANADPSDWPGQGGETPGTTSRRLMFLLLSVVFLAALAAMVAMRNDDSGMEAFCGAYRELSDLAPEARSANAAGDRDSPESRAARAQLEDTNRLARASGNKSVEDAFAAQEAELARLGRPGKTPEDRAREAEQAANVFLDASDVAVEECRSAGYPVSGDS